MTATRFPATSRPSGHWAVWQAVPLKVSMPSISGITGRERKPTQLITALTRQVRGPEGVVAVSSHCWVSSCQAMALTSVLNSMCSRTPKLSATHCMYLRFSSRGQKA